MERRVVISGIGLYSCLGTKLDEIGKKLECNKNTLNVGKFLKIEPFNKMYFGVGDIDDPEMSFYRNLEKIELIALKTIGSCLNDSRLTKEDICNMEDKVGLSLSTSLAGIDHIIKSVEVAENAGEWLVYCRRFINLIMSEIGIGGPCYTTSSACAAGTAGVGLGFDMIKSEEVDMCIVGGVDHLSLFSILGFNSLSTLSRGICRPFDLKRNGINLGEGACFFILEEFDHALLRNAPLYGEILGYGLANDAYSMTSPNPDGTAARYAMEMALREAKLKEDEHIYINAHGTGTMANDSMEIKAIREVWNDKRMLVSSTKSRTGHCLGAAGSIELAIALCSLIYKKQYLTFHSELDITENKEIFQGIETECFKYALSNSFAFAGHAASIVIGVIDK